MVERVKQGLNTTGNRIKFVGLFNFVGHMATHELMVSKFVSSFVSTNLNKFVDFGGYPTNLNKFVGHNPRPTNLSGSPIF